MMAGVDREALRSFDPFERFLAERPEEADRVQRLVNEGRQHLEQGAPDAARGCFVRALSIFPLIPAALTNLAALALHQNQPQQARLYLDKVLEEFPHDPSAHGVAIRYWLERGSRPMAYRHGVQALAGLRALVEREEALHDPTLVDRARVILLSALSSFEADSLITELFALCQEGPWDSPAYTIFGIAFYNVGEFAQARKLWQLSGEAGPGDLLLLLLDLIEEDIVPPFRLDYSLDARLPSLEELRNALHIAPRRRPNLKPVGEVEADSDDDDQAEQQVETVRYTVTRPLPGLAVLEALHHIMRGSADDAELALSILFFERWPYLPELLQKLVVMDQLAMRTRLNAALYQLWTAGVDAARAALQRVEAEPMETEDRLVGHIVGVQIALVAGDVSGGREREAQARAILAQEGPWSETWVAVLDELSLRLHQLEEASGQAVEHVPRRGHSAGEAPSGGNIIPFPRRRVSETDPEE